MAKKDTTTQPKGEAKKTCGIIMPIAEHPEYPNGHWGEVLNILKQALCDTDFEVSMVSDDDAIGLIHERIVTNIYNDNIVICDVSSKNPNVMFELGMRLAFDKPTVIIKDEKANYSFDIGGIQHIEYPSSLRHNCIEEFKKELKERVEATYEKSQKEKGYSPFLGAFGKKIVPAKINEVDVPVNDYIMEELSSMRYEMRQLIKLNSGSTMVRTKPVRQKYTRSEIITLACKEVYNELYKDVPVIDKKEFVNIVQERLMNRSISVEYEYIEKHFDMLFPFKEFSKS